MKFFKLIKFLSVTIFLSGCYGSMNPTGGNYSPDYPYFVTTQQMVIKKINVPVGTTLTYEEQSSKQGQQKKAMNEEKLTSISFPEGEPFEWGGVPVVSIARFFNTEMNGYSVSADFEKLATDKKTKFSELWASCDDNLGITVKNLDDWSFNKNNIADAESCSVNNQRYFKEDAGQQAFLNELYEELLKVNSK